MPAFTGCTSSGWGDEKEGQPGSQRAAKRAELVNRGKRQISSMRQRFLYFFPIAVPQMSRTVTRKIDEYLQKAVIAMKEKTGIPREIKKGEISKMHGQGQRF